ncbi:MAG: superoxide dismutase [Calothrix sp. SM1_5_4]|nr:superoxide dismutase [Calothrix sp. SM1_5_4]
MKQSNTTPSGAPGQTEKEYVTLPPLPYAADALQPHISRETIDFHYGKHHRAYVVKANALLQGHELAGSSLEEIVRKSKGPLFNNAAQIWNHTFFWNCMTPNSRDLQDGALLNAIKTEFGSLDAFKLEFSKTGETLFGSGWAWLSVTKDGKLRIDGLSNAANPMTEGLHPILTLDVWEHAYYIDYRNERPKFVKAFWNVINWAFVEKNFAEAVRKH